MENVLIASLGKSPIVVTAIVSALKEKMDIDIHRVVVMFPEKQTRIDYSLELIENYCLCNKIERWGLPFSDANSEKNCMLFLKEIYYLLKMNRKNNVYLSLAGGRKSISALMSVLTPFYANIKGLFHLLDKNEGTSRQNFHSINELEDRYLHDLELPGSSSEMREIMNPPSDLLDLINIPFEHFANADELIRILEAKDNKVRKKTATVDLSGIPEEQAYFWRNIFTGNEVNSIWLSENARKQLQRHNINRENFERYFAYDKLKNPDWLNRDGANGGKHTKFHGKDKHTVFYIAKLNGIGERIAWFKAEEKIVIAELAKEQDNGNYQRVNGNSFLNKIYFKSKSSKDYTISCRFRELKHSRDVALVAALGKSPMVITQAYVLLKYFENLNVSKIALVFPQYNDDINNSVSLIEKVFKKTPVKIIKYGLLEEDINSEESCKGFLIKMIEVIDQFQQEQMKLNILLSGGRKGMSALSLLAAQRSGVSDVFHTLITDDELENDIEDSGSLERLNKLGSINKKKEVLFLENFKDKLDTNFALFKIPVIPFAINLGA